MRVISGKAKGRKLKRVPKDSTRPVMDRVKESLFNIIGLDVVESRWMDLFAGTGQVGIEALSREATQVIFVEKDKQAFRTIHANLTHTQLEAGAVVYQTDVFAFLRHYSREPVDFIYVAPPQYKEIWLQTLQEIDKAPDRYLSEFGVVIVQIDPKEYKEIELTNLEPYDQRRYGNTQLDFYEW